MLMRIATFEKQPEVDPVRHAEFQRWMSQQPGVVALYYAHDPQTGKHLSVSIWEDREALTALKSQVFPGPPLAIKPDAVSIYEVSAALGPGVAS